MTYIEKCDINESFKRYKFKMKNKSKLLKYAFFDESYECDMLETPVLAG